MSFYPTFILYICAFCGVRTVAPHKDETQMLTVMSQKVDDIWNTVVLTIPMKNNPDNNTYGICNLQPNPKLNESEAKITGLVLLKQSYPDGQLEARFIIKGFPLNDSECTRAIHIHNFGDLSDGCDSTGGHYNPFKVNHPQHPGDFGNFKVQDGKIQKNLSNLEATLFGPYSVFGKSINVHKLTDDLGKGGNQASLENGNAGTRLACCVIGSSSKTSWDKFTALSED
ncbi:extracellular superoxide dismutase [Cu-Zn]-like isoform X2 [Hyla sarda]|nr:extracellular superoxide dismutase [Cu-Zn]-like isoform X2 [Hyla sarda]XP_056411662.1 extracellular superoxide dismutase [Cu-Zn]-like isoform X2 [Hyla sarda]XP_056411670.1 extracellular superoxide dismutase [Cu-Zn]-like isoform X2 [Hyla sarda]XP_056411677.1 extracellular superoxide dismutase [Cu-Zn]-like isoform X2 [Hyla sarda]XP_056411687.1 extracellular superoxide dismutase [Cu-Zn]-like isoform X2 [Hyla sarda]XP_056411694.1 extracellular superoxide dismutase [Cu-Zn]-like isoform X2 [Hyla 